MTDKAVKKDFLIKKKIVFNFLKLFSYFRRTHKLLVVVVFL